MSFIDKSAEFQINRLMDIKSAQLLVRLVPGGRGTLKRHSDVILQTLLDVTLKLIKTIRFNVQITSTFGAYISQMCMWINIEILHVSKIARSR